MRVEILKCLLDNYAYLLVDEEAKVAAVVDASEAEPVIAAVERAGVPLVAVLSTHHHFDHVGGNDALRERYPALEVRGHRSDAGRLPGLSAPVEHGDVFRVGTLEITALHVPGHTLGAVTYVVRSGEGPAWAFTGDTLFLAGCGRLFEGTPAQMFHSLCGVLRALPEDTLIACGHEYTAANLRFAQHVEPNNDAIGARLDAIARAKSATTVPAPLAVERATNPFLRVDTDAVRAHAGADDPIEVLARIRKEKDGFRA